MTCNGNAREKQFVIFGFELIYWAFHPALNHATPEKRFLHDAIAIKSEVNDSIIYRIVAIALLRFSVSLASIGVLSLHLQFIFCVVHVSETKDSKEQKTKQAEKMLAAFEPSE